jgi:hypothetical protein
LISKYPASIAIKLQLCLIIRPIILLTNVKAKIFTKNPTFVAGKLRFQIANFRLQIPAPSFRLCGCALRTRAEWEESSPMPAQRLALRQEEIPRYAWNVGRGKVVVMSRYTFKQA